jgi:SAM-dependent methyltransferase
MRIGMTNKQNRDKWVVKQLSALNNGVKLLDAGAGEQQYKRYCDHLDYTSQDFCEYKGIGDGTGLQKNDWDTSQVDIISDIINIPVEDGAFDAILCTEVFEHLKYPVDTLKEFYRLLKPGGILILTAPFCSLTHYAPYHFYSGFNRYFYEHVGMECGFSNIEITPNGNYFEYIAQEIRRLPSMAERYSGLKFRYMWRLLFFPCLPLLSLLSRSSKNSDELLCYGYHVLARKPEN